MGWLMLLGFSSMNTDDGIRPDVLAVALEERGFDSLWIGEHPHLPATGNTSYSLGGQLPRSYRRMMDPYLSLLAAATASRRLTIATGVALCLERDLFVHAKEIATLDLLSEGRFLFGVGVGWNREELENASDYPWARRYDALRDYVAALRVLWTQETPSFDGEFVSFPAVWSYPKPMRKPHPPVVFGGVGKIGLRHVVEWADQWCPLVTESIDLRRLLGRFRRSCEQAERDAATIPISMFTMDDRVEPLVEARELGVSRVVLSINPADWGSEKKTLEYLDRQAHLVAELA
jgi:probable F420-dependent oxidoreductase